MRHGVRLDEKNPDADWGDKAERPYDTPLATDADSHAVRAAVVGPTRSTGMIPLSFSYEDVLVFISHMWFSSSPI